MEWPLTVADGDAVIVREETTDGPRFVVHSRRGPQLACRTYAEAEARASAHAERTRSYAWYADGRGFQRVGNRDRAVSSPTGRQVGVTPSSKQPGTREKP